MNIGLPSYRLASRISMTPIRWSNIKPTSMTIFLFLTILDSARDTMGSHADNHQRNDVTRRAAFAGSSRPFIITMILPLECLPNRVVNFGPTVGGYALIRVHSNVLAMAESMSTTPAVPAGG